MSVNTPAWYTCMWIFFVKIFVLSFFFRDNLTEFHKVRLMQTLCLIFFHDSIPFVFFRFIKLVNLFLEKLKEKKKTSRHIVFFLETIGSVFMVINFWAYFFSNFWLSCRPSFTVLKIVSLFLLLFEKFYIFLFLGCF